MNDADIINLFWNRDEHAISETEKKYGRYLFNIAKVLTDSEEDALDCVNDTYLEAWDSIPPHVPDYLGAFLGKITKRISIDLLRKNKAIKRGSGEIKVVFDELEECITGRSDVEEEILMKEKIEAINDFLGTISELERRFFVCRYWYADSYKSIAKRYRCTEGKVKMTLKRVRNKLIDYMTKAGL